jgi:hypothetical protein
MVFPQTILSPQEHPDGCMDAARNKLDWFEFVTTALDQRSRKYFFNIILGMILMWTADRFQLAPASDVGQDWLELTGASARGNAAGAGPPNDRRSRPLPPWAVLAQYILRGSPKFKPPAPTQHQQWDASVVQSRDSFAEPVVVSSIADDECEKTIGGSGESA